MILITGAGGFIGQALRKRLTAAGYKVLALLHDKAFAAAANEISLDLTKPEHYKKLIDFCGDCTAVIHLAGRIAIQLRASRDEAVAPRAGAEQFADVYQTNLVMTARLLELANAADFRHVVFASSQTVYGLCTSSPVAEDAPVAPLEHYAASKAACETTLALWSRGHRRKATVLRFPGVWGEGRHHGLVHSLCMDAIRLGRIVAGADYPLPLDILHLDDVTSAFEVALNRSGENYRVYNIATGEPCSLTRLGRDITALVPGCVMEMCGVPQPDITLDATRAAKELGWRARPRRERLAHFIDYLRQESYRA